ncbi:MAG: nucleotide exchange factor GrpE [Spirochaetota bacterium]|nr:nucleotide exchange factor GrpE [Spirochaetota bacterium]
MVKDKPREYDYNEESKNKNESKGDILNDEIEDPCSGETKSQGDIINEDKDIPITEKQIEIEGTETINNDLQKKDEEIQSLMDLLKRRQADFENYKKRRIKEQEEYKQVVIKDIALDILNINDDLLRAIDAASNFSDQDSLEQVHRSFVEGVLMISNRIEDSLKKYGIIEIDSINQEFDPSLNEAVEIDMSEDVKKDTITKVYQKGFRLNDQVLRCSKVKVTKSKKME